MTSQNVLDTLTYKCYRVNRERTPDIKPEEWQCCFDAPVGPMEVRYQAELGQRMNDLLERMHRNQVSAASKQFEVDRENQAVGE